MFESLKDIYIRQCLGMIESLDFVEGLENSTPEDQDLLSHLDIGELKRTLHTIKGGAAALNYQIIQIFAQQGEALVDLENDSHRSCLLLLQIKEMLLKELSNKSSNPQPQLQNKDYTSLELKTIFEELAKKIGKRVQVEVLDETQAIKNLNEEFFLKVLFPLMINAIDHGIETEKERLQSNKYFIAQVRVQISQDEESLKILFSDDGRGNLKSASAEPLTEAQEKSPTNEMDEAQRKSSFSGAGLGLQIMSDYLKEHKGRVRIDSIPGQGSYIRIEIPSQALSDWVWLNAA